MVSKTDSSRKPNNPTTTTIKVTHTFKGPSGTQHKTTRMVLPGAFRLIFEGVAHVG